MTEDASFLDKVYRWYYQVGDNDDRASSKRALAWLDTPNAEIAAQQQGFGKVRPTELLEIARRRLAEVGDLPTWTSPVEAEEYIRAMFDQILAEGQGQGPNGSISDDTSSP